MSFTTLKIKSAGGDAQSLINEYYLLIQTTAPHFFEKPDGREKTMNDKDVFEFLKSFMVKPKHQETKNHVTELYVKGFINYNEFIQRMNKAKD